MTHLNSLISATTSSCFCHFSKVKEGKKIMQNAQKRLRFKHFPNGTKSQDVTVAWQPLQHKTFSINSKSFATTIVSFMTVGPKSRLQNLPLLSCNTSDISESNLQSSLSSFSQELRSRGVVDNSPCFSADLNCKVSAPLLIRTEALVCL